MNRTSLDKPTLLFDGVCNLCNSSVQFIINNDPSGKIQFASLQSDIGQQILKAYGLGAELTSAVFFHKDQYYTKADAALQTASILGGWWNILLVGRVLPKSLRNRVYDWVAANRYRWFGKEESCWVPTPELKARFL